jgi:hypothetical protein
MALIGKAALRRSRSKEHAARTRKRSINKTGHFQTDLMGLAVEVKD